MFQSELKNQGVNVTAHLGVNLTELGAPLGSSLQRTNENGSWAFLIHLAPLCLTFQLPLWCIPLRMLGWEWHYSTHGSLRGLPKDPAQGSCCRDITSEGQGGPGGRFQPSHTCTHRHSHPLKNLPAPGLITALPSPHQCLSVVGLPVGSVRAGQPHHLPHQD